MKYACLLIMVIVMILLTPVEAIPFEILGLKLSRPGVEYAKKEVAVPRIAHRLPTPGVATPEETPGSNTRARQGMKREPSRGGNPYPVSEVLQNYPNPFNPSTTIAYRLPHDSYVDLRVFTILGNEVAMLVQGRRGMGLHHVRFVGRDLPGGIYFCRLEFLDERGGSVIRTTRMALTR